MFISDVSTALTTVFNYVYQFFSITYPGTNVSIFSIFIGVTITSFIISLARQFTGFTFGISSYKGGNSKKINVRNERKDDER